MGRFSKIGGLLYAKATQLDRRLEEGAQSIASNASDLSRNGADVRQPPNWRDRIAGALKSPRFLLVVLTVVSTAHLLRLVWSGMVAINYQGDQGARIFVPVFDANHGWGGLFRHVWQNFFGFHPIGDYITRFLSWKILTLIDASANSPIEFNLTLGVLAGVVTILALSMIALRVSGAVAAMLTFLALNASYSVCDARVSAMGESFFFPAFSMSMWYLVLALRPNGEGERQRNVIVAGFWGLFSSFYRPEVLFLLPGLCIASWWLMGFRHAFVYGAIASFYSAVKIVKPLVISSSGLTLFNAHKYYFTPERTIFDLKSTQFLQQFLSDPALWVVVIGLLSTLIFLRDTNRSSEAWRTVVLLSSAAAAYMIIISVAIVNELTTHNSYRLAVPAVHLLIPVYAISAVEIYPKLKLRLSGGLALGSGGVFARALDGVVLTSAVVFLIAKASSVQSVGLRQRGLDNAALLAHETLERLQPDRSVFIDRMFYWENALIAYFAHLRAPTCNYASCASADLATGEMWKKLRKEPAIAGTTTWAEFAALRSQVFIKEFRPQFILMANEALYEPWVKRAKQIWKDDWQLWYSHLYPSLMEGINYKQPEPVFLRLGTINGLQYFEEYVQLIPRYRTKSVILFEAFYGRKPTPEAVHD